MCPGERRSWSGRVSVGPPAAGDAGLSAESSERSSDPKHTHTLIRTSLLKPPAQTDHTAQKDLDVSEEVQIRVVDGFLSPDEGAVGFGLLFFTLLHAACCIPAEIHSKLLGLD